MAEAYSEVECYGSEKVLARGVLSLLDELARRDAHLTMTFGETLAQHEHGLRFVDDEGCCLACALAVTREALGEAAEALDIAVAIRPALRGGKASRALANPVTAAALADRRKAES